MKMSIKRCLGVYVELCCLRGIEQVFDDIPLASAEQYCGS